jgi:hypothetical protein
MESDTHPNSRGPKSASHRALRFKLVGRGWSRERDVAAMPPEIKYLCRRLSLMLAEPEAAFVLDNSHGAARIWGGCGDPKLTDPLHVNWFISKCIASHAAFERDEADWTVDDRANLTMMDDALHLFASIISEVPASMPFTAAMAAYEPTLAAMRPQPCDPGYARYINDQAREFTSRIMTRGSPRAHDCVAAVEPDEEWRAAAHSRINDVVARFSDMCTVEAISLEFPTEAFRYCVEQRQYGHWGIAGLIQSLSSFWELNGQAPLQGDGDVESLIFAYLRSRLENHRPGETENKALASAFFDCETLIRFCEYLVGSDPVTSPFCVALANHTPSQQVAKFTRAYVDYRASRFDLIRYLPF